MNEEEIIEYLDKKIGALKPEIRKRFVYDYSDEEGNRLGECYSGLRPPLIRFYPKTILRAPDLSTKLLDELINHEVIHTFYHAGEDMATDFQKKVNFFND